MTARTFAARFEGTLTRRCPGVWAEVEGTRAYLSLPNGAMASTWLPDDRRTAATDALADEIIARAAVWLHGQRPHYTERHKTAADALLWLLEHPAQTLVPSSPRAPFAAVRVEPADLHGPRLHINGIATDTQGRTQLICDQAPILHIDAAAAPYRLGPNFHHVWHWATGRLDDEGRAWLMQQWRDHAAPRDLAIEQASLVALMRLRRDRARTGEPDISTRPLEEHLTTFSASDKPRRLDR